MERQDLKGIGYQQTRETDVVENTKYPDEDELSVASTSVGLAGISIDGTGDGPAHERADHTEDGGEEEGATTKPVDAQGSGNGDDQVENGLAGGDTKLGVLIGDTSALVDGVHVVGEKSVTRILRDDTERDDDSQPPAVALSAEEVQVARGSVGVLLDLDGLLDLAELELHSSVADVAAGVPLGENLQSLFVPVLVYEITRGLGNPPDKDELSDRGHNLNEGDGPPRPFAVDVGSAPADAGNNESTQVPQAVVDGSDGTTVLRVADLSEKQRRGHLSERVAEAQNEATGHVHCNMSTRCS
jgi:hypothetical protein